MKHFMIDAETLGVNNIPVITGLCWAEFDIVTGEVGRYEEYAIDARSCIEAGGKVDGSTVEWWLKQDPKAFYDNVIPSLVSGISEHPEMRIGEAVLNFSDFIKRNLCPKEDFRIWSNGLLADAKWLESYTDALGLRDKVCWKYWHLNDARTLVDYLGWQILEHDFKKTTGFVGRKHNPLDDCKFQAKYVSAIYGRFQYLHDMSKKNEGGKELENA